MRTRSKFSCTYAWRVIATVLSALLAVHASARSGDNDSSFGLGTGVVLLAPLTDSDWDTPHAVATYPDGRILQAGQCNDAWGTRNTTVFCVRRFSSAGVLDVTFGTAGVMLPFNAYGFSYSGGFSIDINADGRALVVGTCRGYGSTTPADFPAALRSQTQFACALKLNANDTLDTSFGTNGRKFFSVAMLAGATYGYSSADAISVLSDGRFLVAGACSAPGANAQPRFCVSKHLANGAFDTSYAVQGWIEVPFFGATGYEEVVGLAKFPDGGLLVAGNCQDPAAASRNACAFRLDANGSPVSSFGAGGKASYVGMNAVSINTVPQGRIPAIPALTIVGTCASFYSCARRIDASSGTVDPSFGVTGTVNLSDFGGRSIAPYGAVAWHDGSIFVSGVCLQSPPIPGVTALICVAKLASNGQIDASFGTAGLAAIVGTEGGGYHLPNGIVVDAAARTLTVSSRCYDARGLGFCLARLIVRGNYFDVDGDTATLPLSDAMLYLRYLFGIRGSSLVQGPATSALATRTQPTEIQDYLETTNPDFPNCNKNVVGAPGGPFVFTDGLVLLRTMLGLTGATVTGGINFPTGALRTTWPEIKSHLVNNCGMALN